MNEPLESFVDLITKIKGVGNPLFFLEDGCEILSQLVEVMLQTYNILILLLLLHFCQVVRLP